MRNRKKELREKNKVKKEEEWKDKQVRVGSKKKLRARRRGRAIIRKSE